MKRVSPLPFKFPFIVVLSLLLLLTGYFLYGKSRNRISNYHPVLVVVLMVKNEEAVIVETVKPFIDGGIDAFLIFDTGSTDKTIERIRTYFEQNNITDYAIRQEPFIDFSTSRNRALDLAEEYFPHAGFFIMPDAEWYIYGADKLLAFCKQELESDNNRHHVYSIRTIYKGNSSDYQVPRLYKVKSHIRFTGVIHEMPEYPDPYIKVPHEVFLDHRSSDYGDEKTMARTKRDLELLHRELEKNPNDARSLFYIAQTYTVRGDYHTAIKYHKQRIKLKGFIEEDFLSRYRLAQLLEQLFFKNEATWEEAEKYYLDAFNYRPTRAEPLVHLANHYLQNNNIELAYEYALKACNMPYSSDGLFINKELYDFDRWNILARTAEYLGHYSMSEKAARMALQAHPENNDLQAVLARCQLHKTSGPRTLNVRF